MLIYFIVMQQNTKEQTEVNYRKLYKIISFQTEVLRLFYFSFC